MARKDPTPATLKALFARSGNRCAFSKCTSELVDDLNIFVGEVAHIHSVLKRDARYDATKSADELRHYDNLILVCHSHHKRMDTREDLYPAEKLRAMKAEHETKFAQNVFAIDDYVLAQAALQIVQEDWVPHLDSAIEFLSNILQNVRMPQFKLNMVSADIAQITDAQLFVAYTRLFQAVSPADQIELYGEQDDWRVKRHAYARGQIESRGGSLAKLEYSEAFSAFTKQRIQDTL